MKDDLATLAAQIRKARRLTILTGGGVSAASGVPTFRGQDGLWRRYRPEDLATPEAFARDPGVVWEWYAWRRDMIAGCEPNAAHHVIARWSGSDPATSRLKVVVITQNVDDLHIRAGTQGLVRLHGSIWELSCVNRCAAGSGPWRDERAPLPECPPKCPHCGGLARPAVVWFGESLDPRDVSRCRRHRMRRLPDGRHLLGRLPRRGTRPPGPPPRGVHRRDQPRRNPRLVTRRSRHSRRRRRSSARH